MRNILRCGSLILMLGLCLRWGYANDSLVSGALSGRLTTAGSPYRSIGSITIPHDSSLVVDADVEWKFDVNTTLLVNGTLIIAGTPLANVRLHGTEDQSNQNTSILWEGIQFRNSSALSEISHCKIQNAKVPFTVRESSLTLDHVDADGEVGMMDISFSSVIARNSVFRTVLDFNQKSIVSYNSKLVFTDDSISVRTINNNPSQAYGAYIQGGYARFERTNLVVTSQNAATGYWINLTDSCFFSRNTIQMRGFLVNTGISLRNIGYAANASFINNTITLAEARTNVGVGLAGCRSGRFLNNIIVSNAAQQSIGVNNLNSIIHWNYNLLYGFATPYNGMERGQNDLTVDPMLDPITLHLTAGSPAINAGDPTMPVNTNGSVSDLGAHEYPVTNVNENVMLPESIALMLYPNPFNSTVRMSIPASGTVNWKVFDRLGRIVASNSGKAVGGSYHAEWHPPSSIGAGWYTMEVVSERGIARRSLCYLR